MGQVCRRQSVGGCCSLAMIEEVVIAGDWWRYGGSSYTGTAQFGADRPSRKRTKTLLHIICSPNDACFPELSWRDLLDHVVDAYKNLCYQKESAFL